MLKKLFKRLKSKIISSKGFLTKKGALIDYAEWHAFGIGFLDGVDYHGKGYRLNWWMDKHPDVEEEPHYYEIGYSSGRTTKYLFLIGLALYFREPALAFI